jgi:hypothetical protein
MNAALHFASALPRSSLVRLVRGRTRKPWAARDRDIDASVRRAFVLDLVALLNGARRADLERVAALVGVDPGGPVGELRARLWRRGAELEAGGTGELGRPWQPVPHVLGGRLIHLGPQRGAAPPAPRLPRPVPAAPVGELAAPDELDTEPDTLEDLLERATRLLGVRLGRAGRDKGEFGARVARMLGVRELGHAEPDWRGEVELKTVPVVRDRGGLWRVKEDPAVSMDTVAPESKLGRVLWIARVADAGDSPILSWYYQERDAMLDQLLRAALHTRPKGGAGDRTRGWYLHKRFFARSGFLFTLNGWPAPCAGRCSAGPAPCAGRCSAGPA